MVLLKDNMLCRLVIFLKTLTDELNVTFVIEHFGMELYIYCTQSMHYIL